MQIAIIGAGVMGLSCGIELSQLEDVQITIYDDPDTHAASQYAGGMLAPYSESDTLAPHLQKLAFDHSLPFWADLARHHQVHFKSPGTLVLAHPEDAPLLKRFATHLPQGSFEKVFRPQDMEPHISKRISHGLHVYDEAYLDTSQILNAMKSGFEISLTSQTPETLNDFDLVIDARGHQSDMKGLRRIKGERVLLRCPDLNLGHCVRLMHPRYPLYVVPHAQDLYMVGASMIEDNNNKAVSVRSALELLTAFTSLSSLGLEADIISIDAGFRPAFEDHVPQITKEGKILRANGLYRHGFLLAPILAKAIKAHILGQSFDPCYMAFAPKEDCHEHSH